MPSEEEDDNDDDDDDDDDDDLGEGLKKEREIITTIQPERHLISNAIIQEEGLWSR
jgi:hypothetical protein